MVADTWQIQRVLGHGGMGIVYLAYDLTSQQQVAIKIPLAHPAEKEVAFEVFAREAEVWSRLHHPLIVRPLFVRDDAATDYRPAIVMEYCPGGSLRAVIDSHPEGLPLPRALAVALEVCWALEFAHAQGFSHRDVKPDNVLLSDDGRARVSDFGIAARRRDLLGAGADEPPRPLGGWTRGYAPPEQYSGAATAAVDVYAFGVTLHELVSGRQLDHGEDGPDLRALPSHVPHALGTLIGACLAKVPEARPTMAELSVSLTTLHDEVGGKCLPVKPRDEEIATAAARGKAEQLRDIALIINWRGQRERAVSHLVEAQQLFLKLDDGPALATCLFYQAQLTDGPMACELLGRARTLFSAAGADTGVASCDAAAAGLAIQDRDLVQARAWTTRALEVFEQHRQTQGRQNCHSLLTRIHYLSGEFDEALGHGALALTLAKELGDPVITAAGHSAIAHVHHSRGDYDRSIECYREELALLQHAGRKRDVAACLNQIGEAAREMRDLLSAKRAYQQGLRLYQELDDGPGQAAILNNLGTLARKNRAYQGSEAFHRRAEELSVRHGDQAQLSTCYLRLGLLAEAQGQHELGLQHYQRSAAIKEAQQDKLGLATCYENMAAAAGALGDAVASRQYAKESRRLREAMGIDPDMWRPHAW